jgi:hypothetical protein
MSPPRQAATPQKRRTATPQRRQTTAPQKRQTTPEQSEHRQGVTITIPRPVADVVTAPFVLAGRVLPAGKGLPLYLGVGVLAAVEIIEWPVAAGIGIGYAAIRKWGPQQGQNQPHRDRPQDSPEG